MTTSITSILKAAGIAIVSSLSQMNGIIDSTSNGSPAIVNVYAEYCGYSHKMAPAFADDGQTYASSIHFWGADIGTVDGVASKLSVNSLPTFVGFACGKERGRVVGADEDGLKKLAQKLQDTKC